MGSALADLYARDPQAYTEAFVQPVQELFTIFFLSLSFTMIVSSCVWHLFRACESYVNRTVWRRRWEKRDALPQERDLTCVICLESVNKGPVKRLECEHVYHAACIDKWFDACDEMRCPTCQRVYAFPEVVIVHDAFHLAYSPAIRLM